MNIFNFDTSDFFLKVYDKNQIIKNEGDLCTSVGFILSGEIYITNTRSDDSEFVIQHLSRGELFGETLIFSKNNHYPGYIYALTETKVLYINKFHFIQKLSDDEDFKLFYLNYISEKYIALQERLKILSQSNIQEMFLFYLKIQLSKTNLDYVYVPSITKLAHYLNVPRPSLSRCISKLILDKKIYKHKKYYYITN